jgi:hypothetical protein
MMPGGCFKGCLARPAMHDSESSDTNSTIQMVFYDLNVPWNVTLPTAESPSKNSKKQKGKPAAAQDFTAPKGLSLLSESNQATLKACLDMLIHRMLHCHTAPGLL